MVTNDWTDVPFVRDQLEVLRNDWRLVAERMNPFMLFAKARGVKSWESPIEVVFNMWWWWIAIPSVEDALTHLELDPQRDVVVSGERFRLDFAVQPSDPIVRELARRHDCEMRFAIELDGHEFHERTKEQVARRNHRDRVLSTNGWTVMHVSGSELVNLDGTCVFDVREAAVKAHGQMRERLSAALALGKE